MKWFFSNLLVAIIFIVPKLALAFPWQASAEDCSRVYNFSESWANLTFDGTELAEGSDDEVFLSSECNKKKFQVKIHKSVFKAGLAGTLTSPAAIEEFMDAGVSYENVAATLKGIDDGGFWGPGDGELLEVAFNINPLRIQRFQDTNRDGLDIKISWQGNSNVKMADDQNTLVIDLLARTTPPPPPPKPDFGAFFPRGDLLVKGDLVIADPPSGGATGEPPPPAPAGEPATGPGSDSAAVATTDTGGSSFGGVAPGQEEGPVAAAAEEKACALNKSVEGTQRFFDWKLTCLVLAIAIELFWRGLRAKRRELKEDGLNPLSLSLSPKGRGDFPSSNPSV